MSILITGANGFVGSNLYPFLSNASDRSITCVIREGSGLNFTLTGGDRRITYSELSENGSSFSHYIHLAGKAHDLKNTSDEASYFNVNYGLTKKLYDRFLEDEMAETFTFISSVKAAADTVQGELKEDHIPQPVTAYGRSKLKAENYILDNLPDGKRVIILRPCMIHGPGNKGNLNQLQSLISKGIPWPLGAYDNVRSFLSIENLCFVIGEIMEGKVSSGIYNVADDGAMSTMELVSLIAELSNKKPRIWSLPKTLIRIIAGTGKVIPLPLNEERLEKLTENYLVSNAKIKRELGIEKMPVSARDGMIRTLTDLESL